MTAYTPTASACVAGILVGTAVAVTIETVPVGNPGNAPDTRYAAPGYGSVSYVYNVGKHEVTTGQYTAFLNAVAGVDTYALYNANMSRTDYGSGITRSGGGTMSNPYTYSVASEYLNRPVNYVSWGDAARFANWLHNGQPTGPQDTTTTEDGAYCLKGATSDSALLAVKRKSNWKWAITSEDEWYKAAYHRNDGATGNYWDYPTSTSHINTSMANYSMSVDYPTTVGGYPYPSPYGTFDQGGNVWEWNEAVIGSYCGLRGGAFDGYGGYLHASGFSSLCPPLEFSSVGFRVSEVPEPAAVVLLGLAGVGILRRRKATSRSCSSSGRALSWPTGQDPIPGPQVKLDCTGANWQTLRWPITGCGVCSSGSGYTLEAAVT